MIFQEREEKSNQATAPTVEAKAKDVSVFFFIFTLLSQIKECYVYFRSRSRSFRFITFWNLVKQKLNYS